MTRISLLLVAVALRRGKWLHTLRHLRRFPPCLDQNSHTPRRGRAGGEGEIQT